MIKHLYSKPQKQFQTFQNDNVPTAPPYTKIYLCKAKITLKGKLNYKNIYAYSKFINIFMVGFLFMQFVNALFSYLYLNNTAELLD